MFQYEKPAYLEPGKLDEYLSKGWYRYGQHIFTIDAQSFADNNGNIFFEDKVYWLRIVVAQFAYSRGKKNILRMNGQFTVDITDYYINDEIENLFARYRSAVNFTHAGSVYKCLHLDGETNIFDTKLITIKAGNKLIAAGYFDIAANSIAGILNFYDPRYSKMSLGKFLMLKKIEYAKACQKDYYYVGYIAKQYSKFDYKLMEKAATEVYNINTKTWQPYNDFKF